MSYIWVNIYILDICWPLGSNFVSKFDSKSNYTLSLMFAYFKP